MFGEKVHCLGAEKITSLNKIRGSSWKYMYGDELATWNQETFAMAKSRLDHSYSMADMTLNPEYPGHWAKQFIDSDVDIFLQNYTIDDNPFLDAEFVANLKREYAGTIYYNRYILGQWVRAEGAVYPVFSEKNIIDSAEKKREIIDKIRYIEIGGDFGGNKSATVYNAMGYWMEPKVGLCSCCIAEFYDKANLHTESIKANFKNFVEMIRKAYPSKPVADAYLDSAEQLIIKSMRNMGVCNIEGSLKRPIIDRIRLENSLFNLGRFSIFDNCKELIDAFHAAVWDEKSMDEKRLDNGSTNIDSLDALEYSLERHIHDFVY
ncbi:MAG: terminase large subunit domain-containing protein, partial [Sphaerochaetaceae bacterium]